MCEKILKRKAHIDSVSLNAKIWVNLSTHSYHVRDSQDIFTILYFPYITSIKISILLLRNEKVRVGEIFISIVFEILLIFADLSLKPTSWHIDFFKTSGAVSILNID